MPQFARPNSDISFSANWNLPESNKFEEINEAVADDNDATTCPISWTQTTGHGEFGLSVIQDPGSHASHIIRYRVKQLDTLLFPGSMTIEVRVILKEGTTVIATGSWESIVGEDVYQDFSYTLLEAEANEITNAGYAGDLRLRFELRTLDAEVPDAAKFALSFAEFEVPAGTPNAPKGLALTPGWKHIIVEWEDDSDNEDGFIVERRRWPDGEFDPLIITPPDTIIITDPIPPTVIPPPEPPRYCYRVKAFNSFGESDYTSEECTDILEPITNSITTAQEPADITYFKERGERPTYE